MKKLVSIFILIIITACTTNKEVFWCGDHPCVNKKEKEAYFKKTMIVEIRELDKSNKKKKSELEKVMQQARIDEKKRIIKEKSLAKQIKLEKKMRAKQEKILAKQEKQQRKKEIKEAKALNKKIKTEEKKIVKEEKILAKEIENVERQIAKKSYTQNKPEVFSEKFEDIAKKIIEKNSVKPFPNINNIPY